jgi:inhibitor of cysteine peptidase
MVYQSEKWGFAQIQMKNRKGECKMKQHNSIKSWLTIIIVIVLAGLALSFLAVGSGGVAKAQPRVAEVPASWEYQLDSSDTTPASAQQLNINGVAAKVQALGDSSYRLVMSGSQGTEQIRQALYSPLMPGFIEGVAEIEISMPVSALKNITVDLENNLTTGYQWMVVSGAGFTQVGASTFTQSIGVGAPSMQTLVLQPKALGNGSIKLTYRRSFGPTETATRHLSITLAAQAVAIDLSNPAPKPTTAVNDPVVGSVDPQNPADELPPNPSLAAALDWRTAGIVPAVRNQGAYGSCWAFSTVGAMESAIKKAGGPMTDLSEQFLISCNKDGWGDGGLTAHKYHYNTLGLNQTAVGAVLESAKPYIAAKGTCSVAYSHPYKLSNWGFILGSEFTQPTIAQIKTAISTYGPISAAVCADSGWSSYTGGVYTPTSNGCGGSINHAIILVGWDDATSSWILRNSWGSSWGEGGYMRIRYDSSYTTSHVGERASWVSSTNNPPAPIPTLLAPAGTITDTTPTYKWSKVTGATQYQYQLFQGATLIYTKTVASGACGATTNCVNTPANVLPYAAYTWKARAFVGGVWKAFSAAKAFTITNIPTPLTPVGAVTDTTPTYTFSKIAGATQYQYQLFKGATLIYTKAVTAAACGATTNCVNTPTNVLTAGAYTWKVRAMLGGVWKAFSAAKAFTIISGPVNGNFESGSTGWTQYSTHGWPIIVTSFPSGVTAHGGSHAAWLGGDYADISYIQQQVTIPSGAPHLVYWHWIASADVCGYDFGGVMINGSVVAVYNLCSSTNTGGWVKHSVNLSAYAGQSVSLQIRVETDSSFNSNLFIDDVTFQSTAASVASGPIGPNLDAATMQGKPGRLSQGDVPEGLIPQRIWQPLAQPK